VPAHFSILHRVQFCETDMAGIVHFANYFRMMEEVEHAYFRSLGFSISMQHNGMHIGWPRVSSSCEFTQPVHFEDELELQLSVVRVGDKSLSYEVAFMRGSTQVALGKSTSVCCALENGKMKSVSIPAELRAKLTA
jgi:acyl-CoA thioester hydrolase